MPAADPDVVSALREALRLAERGSIRAVAIAALADDGEPLRVICAESKDIAALLGTMTLVQHSLIHGADDDDEDDEEPEDDAAVSLAMFGPSKGDA